MAEVQIVINDIEGNTCDLELEPKIKTFLTEWDLESDFYQKDDTQLVVLKDLSGKDLSTGDGHDDGFWILNLLSKINLEQSDESPGFSLGETGFSNEFYKQLHQIVPDLYIYFNATVLGYGDGYTVCTYSLSPGGWSVKQATLYAWDEDMEEYVREDD